MMRSFLSTKLLRLARSSKGAAAIEYAVLIALVACAVTLALMGLGRSVNGTMTTVQKELPSNTAIEIRIEP